MFSWISQSFRTTHLHISLSTHTSAHALCTRAICDIPIYRAARSQQPKPHSNAAVHPLPLEWLQSQREASDKTRRYGRWVWVIAFTGMTKGELVSGLAMNWLFRSHQVLCRTHLISIYKVWWALNRSIENSASFVDFILNLMIYSWVHTIF